MVEGSQRVQGSLVVQGSQDLAQQRLDEAYAYRTGIFGIRSDELQMEHLIGWPSRPKGLPRLPFPEL